MNTCGLQHVEALELRGDERTDLGAVGLLDGFAVAFTPVVANRLSISDPTYSYEYTND